MVKNEKKLAREKKQQDWKVKKFWIWSNEIKISNTLVNDRIKIEAAIEIEHNKIYVNDPGIPHNRIVAAQESLVDKFEN
jgi:hypothetical protein